VVRHPETLEATALVAGQAVPDWASDLVHADDFEADAEGAEPEKRTTAKTASSSKTEK
jgi:hypothetical protein